MSGPETIETPLASSGEAALQSLQPDTYAGLQRMLEVVWEGADPVQLELARLRIAEMLGDPVAQEQRSPAAARAGLDPRLIEALDEWSDSSLFGAREKAHLAAAEQFSVSVSNLSDAEIEGIRQYASDEETFDFFLALYAIEMDIRLHLAAQAMFPTKGQ